MNIFSLELNVIFVFLSVFSSTYIDNNTPYKYIWQIHNIFGKRGEIVHLDTSAQKNPKVKWVAKWPSNFSFAKKKEEPTLIMQY